MKTTEKCGVLSMKRSDWKLISVSAAFALLSSSCSALNRSDGGPTVGLALWSRKPQSEVTGLQLPPVFSSVSTASHARAEGLSASELASPLNLAFMTRYLNKYVKGWFEAPTAQIDYFNHQRLLLDIMSRARRPTGADNAQIVRMANVGDIMWAPVNWAEFIGDDVQAALSSQDIVFGNLETPISRSQPVCPNWQPECVKFNSPPELLTAFQTRPGARNLFSALSLANNHTFDAGDGGAIETKDFVESLGIRSSGLQRLASDQKYVVVEAHGLRFGYYAATYGYNEPSFASQYAFNVLRGIARSDDEIANVDFNEVKSVLADMIRDEIDVRVVSLHWGHEFEHYPTRAQMLAARQIVAAGADIIVGSHPHVIQPSEVCFVNGSQSRWPRELLATHQESGCVINGVAGPARTAMIYYSLGNFTTAGFPTYYRIGAIQRLEFWRDPIHGRAEWFNPNHDLVFNKLAGEGLMHGRLRRPGARRLRLFDSFVAQGCDGGCTRSHLRLLRFYKSHLSGRIDPDCTKPDCN